MSKKLCQKNIHWADFCAQKTLDSFPNEEVYTVASGITPSGFIHVGNFREVITSEIVKRALEDKGKKTKFLYSWDSYDRFRKVPSDVPEEFEKYIGMPVGVIPSPFSENKTYADEFIQTFEEDVKDFGLDDIDFQKQHKLQTSGIYSESIKKVLQNKEKIIEILNRYRSEDRKLDSSYWPFEFYDRDTKKDTNKILDYDGENTITYLDENEDKKEINFFNEPNLKLKWKADWPMRWDYFKVCFEPGGKDHSTPGSSYTVGSNIIREIFNREPPQYIMYDFVKMKGEGSKISSSKGGALRIRDLNKIYTTEIIMFMFAGTLPKKEIDLSFDLDVIKIYEDFDKCEREYYNNLDEEDKSVIKLKRSYELSQYKNNEPQKNMPEQFGFRHLTSLVQSNDFDIEKVKSNFKIENDFDMKRFYERVNCAKNWVLNYAPSDMRFKIVDKLENIEEVDKRILKILKDKLIVANEPKDLMEVFKKISNDFNIEIKDLFQKLYTIFLKNIKGPKLGGLMIENKTKFLKLLEDF